MKSGGPWNLRGLLPEVREAARAAARRCGQSVGEWLNSVIEVVDEQDGEFVPSNGFDRFSDDGSHHSVRSDDRRQRDTDWDDRQADAQMRQHRRAEDPEQDRRYRHADWDDREAKVRLRQHGRAEDPEYDRRYRHDDWDDHETHGNWRRHLRAEDPQHDRRPHDSDQDVRETNGHWHQHPRAEVPQQNRRYRDSDQDDRGANDQWRRADERQLGHAYYDRHWDDREANDQSPHDYPGGEREPESRYCDCNEREANDQSRQNCRAKERRNDRPDLSGRWRDRASVEEAADRHYQGGPYREDRRSETGNRRRTQARSADDSHYPTHGDRETAIDQAASKIRTRQHELDAIDRGREGYRSDQSPSEKRRLVTAPGERPRIRS